MSKNTESGRASGRTSSTVVTATFLVTLALCFLAGDLATQHLESLGYARRVIPSEVIPEGKWYTDTALGIDSLSHEVMFHNLDGSMDAARDVDILILGNSRMMFAFPYKVMDEFVRKHSLRYFSMGFGHSEADRFPRILIEKYDLRPRLVIVNEDNFFHRSRSLKAKSVVGETSWDAWKNRLESAARFSYESRLRPILPHFFPTIPPPFSPDTRDASAVLRSSDTGSWLIWNRRDRKVPVKDRGELPITKWSLGAAAEFRDFLAERGAELVITYVPVAVKLGSSRSRSAEIARSIEVPFLSPQLEGLVTRDRSHLNEPSAERFCSALLSELESEPVFARLVEDR